jgi:hypothetical protein
VTEKAKKTLRIASEADRSHTSAEYPQYMNPVDLTYTENENSRVLVEQPEETRKAEFCLDSLKRQEKQSFGWTA